MPSCYLGWSELVSGSAFGILLNPRVVSFSCSSSLLRRRCIRPAHFASKLAISEPNSVDCLLCSWFLSYFVFWTCSIPHSLAGALQYLTFTRPDLTYAVQQVCLYMHDPRESHLGALKRLLRYVRGTVDLGLVLHCSSSAELVVYTDADWAGCPDTRRSTSGYAVFLGGNLVSWSSKRQPVVSRSSAEAEYRTVANGVAEAS